MVCAFEINGDQKKFFLVSDNPPLSPTSSVVSDTLRFSRMVFNTAMTIEGIFRKVLTSRPASGQKISACYTGECKNCPSNSLETGDGDRKSLCRRSRILGLLSAIPKWFLR